MGTENIASWALTGLPTYYWSVLSGPVPYFHFPSFMIAFWVALVALVVGIVWGIVRREPNLLRFILAIAASHGFMYAVSLASAIPIALMAVVLIFIIVELILLRVAFKRSLKARGAAWLLTGFSIVYAGAAIMILLALLSG